MKKAPFITLLVKVAACTRMKAKTRKETQYYSLIGKQLEVINWGKSYYKYIKDDKTSILILKSDCQKVLITPTNNITVDDNLELEEQVNHPIHYGGAHNKYEAIKVIEALNMDFHLGNTYKYLARAGVKSKDTEIEDLQKAAWYLNRKIENLKKQK